MWVKSAFKLLCRLCALSNERSFAQSCLLHAHVFMCWISLHQDSEILVREKCCHQSEEPMFLKSISRAECSYRIVVSARSEFFLYGCFMRKETLSSAVKAFQTWDKPDVNMCFKLHRDEHHMPFHDWWICCSDAEINSDKKWLDFEFGKNVTHRGRMTSHNGTVKALAWYDTYKDWSSSIDGLLVLMVLIAVFSVE